MAIINNSGKGTGVMRVNQPIRTKPAVFDTSSIFQLLSFMQQQKRMDMYEAREDRYMQNQLYQNAMRQQKYYDLTDEENMFPVATAQYTDKVSSLVSRQDAILKNIQKYDTIAEAPDEQIADYYNTTLQLRLLKNVTPSDIKAKAKTFQSDLDRIGNTGGYVYLNEKGQAVPRDPDNLEKGFFTTAEMAERGLYSGLNLDFTLNRPDDEPGQAQINPNYGTVQTPNLHIIGSDAHENVESKLSTQIEYLREDVNSETKEYFTGIERLTADPRNRTGVLNSVKQTTESRYGKLINRAATFVDSLTPEEMLALKQQFLTDMQNGRRMMLPEHEKTEDGRRWKIEEENGREKVVVKNKPVSDDTGMKDYVLAKMLARDPDLDVVKTIQAKTVMKNLMQDQTSPYNVTYFAYTGSNKDLLWKDANLSAGFSTAIKGGEVESFWEKVFSKKSLDYWYEYTKATSFQFTVMWEETLPFLYEATMGEKLPENFTSKDLRKITGSSVADAWKGDVAEMKAYLLSDEAMEKTIVDGEPLSSQVAREEKRIEKTDLNWFAKQQHMSKFRSNLVDKALTQTDAYEALAEKYAGVARLGNLIAASEGNLDGSMFMDPLLAAQAGPQQNLQPVKTYPFTDEYYKYRDNVVGSPHYTNAKAHTKNFWMINGQKVDRSIIDNAKFFVLYDGETFTKGLINDDGTQRQGGDITGWYITDKETAKKLQMKGYEDQILDYTDFDNIAYEKSFDDLYTDKKEKEHLQKSAGNLYQLMQDEDLYVVALAAGKELMRPWIDLNNEQDDIQQIFIDYEDAMPSEPYTKQQ